MVDDLYTLFWITCAMGAVNVALVRAIARLWAAPSLFYWSIWALVPIIYQRSLVYDLLPEPMPLTFDLVLQAHIGAFIAFVAASAVGRVLRSPARLVRAERTLHRELDDVRFDTVLRWLVWIVLAQGFLMFAYRVAVVGHVDVSFLYEARESFIAKDKGRIRALLWMQPMLWPVSAMVGWALVRQRRDIRRTAFILALGVLFMCFGDASRFKMIFSPVMIAIGAGTSLATRRLESQWRFLKTHAYKLAGVLLVVLALAQVMGVVRRSGTVEGVAEALTNDREVTAFMSYLAQGTSAVAPVLIHSAPMPVGGDLTFPFMTRMGTRIGLVGSQVLKPEVLDMDAFRIIDPRIAWGGTSSLGVLAADWGADRVGWAHAVIMFISQLGYLLFTYRGLGGYLLATQFCFVALISFQNIWLLDATMVRAVFWGFVIAAVLERQPRRRRSRSRRQGGRRIPPLRPGPLQPGQSPLPAPGPPRMRSAAAPSPRSR